MNETHREMLEAAQLVYYKFWGENLNDILRPVPNYGDWKYLTEEQIVDLKLRRLLYGETVLLVREEYEVCYNALKDSNSRLTEAAAFSAVIWA